MSKSKKPAAKTQAMVCEPDIIRIPLDKLFVSPLNVRKVAGDNIEALADNITHEGLLQNLTVHPDYDSRGDASGLYGVAGGGRRLAALKLLARRKKLSKSFPVPCRVVTFAQAQSASLSENVMRQDMHPADQFEAFRQLVDAGRGVEQIAAHFGVTPAVVTRRLALARVAPELLDEYRIGSTTLEVLQAFTLTDDHQRQREIYDSLRPFDGAQAVRRILTDAAVAIERDARALFVGESAYTAAGGTVRRDLFAADADAYMEDGALLESLAVEQLEPHAETLRDEGWAWVEICPIFDYEQRSAFSVVRPVRATPDDETQDRISALDAETERLQDELEALEQSEADDDETVARIEALEAALTATDEAQEAIEASLNDWPDEVKAHAGAIVTLADNGTPHLLRGFVRAEDRAAATVAEQTATPTAPGTPKQPSESAAVVLSLSAHRTGILQSAFARQPDVALRVLAFHLASGELYREGYSDAKDYSLLDLRVTEHAGDRSNVGHDYEAMPAASDYDLIRDRLMHQLPADADDAAMWQFFLTCPAELVQETIAVALAPAIDGLRRYPNRPDTSGPLAAALDAHDGAMAAMWEPTRANYLGKVPMSLILRAVSEARGPETALQFAKLKRDPLIDAAERSLTGTGWLPLAMRSPVAPEGDDTRADDDSDEAAAA